MLAMHVHHSGHVLLVMIFTPVQSIAQYVNIIAFEFCVPLYCYSCENIN